MNKVNQFRWHGFWIFCIAILTRCLYFFQYQENPYFDHYNDFTDSLHFDLGAQSFANGDWLATAPFTHFAPLYKYFLGIIYWVTGRDLPILWCVQFFFGALTVLFIFLICKHQFNIRTAWIAGLLYNFHGPVLMYEGLISPAFLIAFLGVTSLYALIRLPRSPSCFRLITTAIPVALFVQCRPNVLIVFVFVLIFFLRWFEKGFLSGISIKSLFSSKETRRLLLQKLCSWPKSVYAGISKDSKRLVFIVFLFCLPALIQAYIVQGKFVLFSSQGSAAFLQGNQPAHLGMGYDPAVRFTGDEQLGVGETLLMLTSRFIESPAEMAFLYARKTYFLFCSFQVPDDYDFKLFQEFSFLLQTPLSNFGMMSSLGLVGFALGMREFRRRRLLYAYSVGMAVGALLIVIMARYRIPVLPYFAIWAGFTLDRIASWHESKRYVRSAVGTVSVAALFTFLNSPYLIPDYKLKGHLSYDYKIGVNYFRGERYSEALQRLLKFRKEFPDNSESLRFTSASYLKLGEVERAKEELEKLVTLEWDNLWARKLLGDFYFKEENYSKAITHLQAYVIGKPEEPKVYAKLGRAYFKLGNVDRAIVAWKESLSLDPSNASYQWLLGTTLFQSGKFSESRPYLKAYMDIEPKHRLSRKFYALTYCNQGEWGDCVEEFKKYFSLSPEDAKIHFFVSTVYRKLGNDLLAIMHASKAYESFSADPAASVWAQRSYDLLLDIPR